MLRSLLSYRSITFLLLFLFISPVISGQDIYRTVEGKVRITGRTAQDSALKATSNHLIVLIHHKTGEFTMKLDQSTLHTGVDSIDRQLEQRPLDHIEFSGKLGTGGFDPNHCYSPTPFDIKGTLEYEGRSRELKGTGEFKSRFSNDRIPCMLEISLELDLDDVDWEHFLPGFDDKINVRILQAILNPQYN